MHCQYNTILQSTCLARLGAFILKLKTTIQIFWTTNTILWIILYINTRYKGILKRGGECLRSHFFVWALIYIFITNIIIMLETFFLIISLLFTNHIIMKNWNTLCYEDNTICLFFFLLNIFYQFSYLTYECKYMQLD